MSCIRTLRRRCNDDAVESTEVILILVVLVLGLLAVFGTIRQAITDTGTDISTCIQDSDGNTKENCG